MHELYIKMSIVENNDTKFMKNKMEKIEQALILFPLCHLDINFKGT